MGASATGGLGRAAYCCFLPTAATYSAGLHPVVTTLLVVVGLLLGYLATYRGKAQLPTLEQLTLNITRERIKGQFLVKLRNHVPLNLQIDSLSYTAHVDGKQLA